MCLHTFARRGPECFRVNCAGASCCPSLQTTVCSKLCGWGRGISLQVTGRGLAAVPRSHLRDQDETMMDESHEVTVREWLDTCRRGWGAKWATGFEALGFDLVEDLAAAEDDDLEELWVCGMHSAPTPS